MSEHAFSRLNVLQQSIVDAFVEGDDVPEDARVFRKWIRKVWWGSSHIYSRVEVKRLCCGDDESRKATAFDPVRKLWGTYALENVPRLIASGLWSPEGIDRRLADIIAVRATAVLDRQARTRRENEDLKVQKEREKAEGAKRGGVRAAAKKMLGRSAATAEEDTPVAKEDPPAAPTGQPPLPETFKATADDIAEVLSVFKIPEAIFVESSSWAWLGPVCSSSIVRIRRWFNFPKNRTRGIDAVATEDFLEYHEKRTRERQLAKEDDEAAAAKTRVAVVAPAPAGEERFERLKKRERERVHANKEAAKRQKHEDLHGEHAVAMRALLDKAAKAGPMRPTTILRCHACGTRPFLQFMQCECDDGDEAGWEACKACDTVFHPRKVLCGCKRVDAARR